MHRLPPGNDRSGPQPHAPNRLPVHEVGGQSERVRGESRGILQRSRGEPSDPSRSIQRTPFPLCVLITQPSDLSRSMLAASSARDLRVVQDCRHFCPTPLYFVHQLHTSRRWSRSAPVRRHRWDSMEGTAPSAGGVLQRGRMKHKRPTDGLADQGGEERSRSGAGGDCVW